MIHSGCMTSTGTGEVTFTASKRSDIVFGGRNLKTLLTITSEGDLIPGDGLSDSQAARDITQLLVKEFGRAYGSALRHAEADKDKAEHKVRQTIRERDDARNQLDRAQEKIKAIRDLIQKLADFAAIKPAKTPPEEQEP